MKEIIIKPVSGYEAKLFYNKVFAPSWWPKVLQPQEHAIKVPDNYTITENLGDIQTFYGRINPKTLVYPVAHRIRGEPSVFLECGNNVLQIEYAIIDGVKIPADYVPCECDVERMKDDKKHVLNEYLEIIKEVFEEKEQGIE